MDGVAHELSPRWAIEGRAAIVLLAQRTQRTQYILLPCRTLQANALSAERSRSVRDDFRALRTGRPRSQLLAFEQYATFHMIGPRKLIKQSRFNNLMGVAELTDILS